MASQNLNQIFRVAAEFAENMLAKEGGFIPFGVSMDVKGDICYVAGDAGWVRSSSEDVIFLLESSFIEGAAVGAIRAAGVCIDIRVILPGEDAKSDAICVRLAHISGEALEVFAPYVKNSSGKYVFGDIFSYSSKKFRLVDKTGGPLLK